MLIRQLRILWLFYRMIALPSVIISVASGVILSYNGTGPLPVLLGLKLFSLAVMAYFIHTFRGQRFYFFYNLGWGIRRLWLRAIMLDLFLFILIVMLSIWAQ